MYAWTLYAIAFEFHIDITTIENTQSMCKMVIFSSNLNMGIYLNNALICKPIDNSTMQKWQCDWIKCPLNWFELCVKKINDNARKCMCVCVNRAIINFIFIFFFHCEVSKKLNHIQMVACKYFFFWQVLTGAGGTPQPPHANLCRKADAKLS